MPSKLSTLLHSLLSYILPRKPTPNPNPTPSHPLFLHPTQILSQPPESFPPSITGGHLTWRTLLSSPQTPSKGLIAGIATCPLETGHLCPHRHAQPELYYVISGKGVVEIEGRREGVRTGSVVFIPGGAEHGVWNLGGGVEDLVWLYVFPGDGFREVCYRWRGEDY